MPDLAILLEPSKTKQPGGNPFAPDMFDYRTSGTFNYFDELNPERRKLIDRLQALIDEGDDETLMDVFGVEDDFELEEAKRINDEIYNAPLMSALDRYSPGTMYAAMDFANLPTGAQRRLLENGILLSGLFGLLRPDDLIPDYRLRMSADVPGLGPMADYWRDHVSPLLNKTVEGRFVWDLLPATHHAAWDDTHAYTGRAQFRFLVEDDDGARAPADPQMADLVRGDLVNFVVRETAEDLEEIEEWENEDEFVYDPDATEHDEATKTWTLTFVQQED
jgi:hypothetical protein